MPFAEIIAIIIYVSILFGIGFASYKRNLSADDFIIGSRSLNYWVTALSAGASDMGTWLFLAFPAMIFTTGLFSIWLAVGLTIFMFLNWHFIAPKLRTRTEEYNSLTFSSFFESRFADTSGLIRIFTALISLIFFTIYVSAGVMGVGWMIESLFGINYHIGITVGMCIVIPYLFIGGYRTLAWIDLFQGLFLLCVIVFVPLYALPIVGGFPEIFQVIDQKHLSMSVIPSFTWTTFLQILFAICGWGLGYFGQPHIATKFMGISNVKDMRKSKYVGMTWQVIILCAAILVGLVSISYFQGGIDNPELVFVEMVKNLFTPFVTAFILCAVLAATISTMDSQILVLASSLTEDFYKRIFRKGATSSELLIVSRVSVLLVAATSYAIAFFYHTTTIYSLVLYAWSGLGSSFGPILIFSLYSKSANRYGAWAGIITGGMVSGLWPTVNHLLPIMEIPSLIPGFGLSCFVIWFVSQVTKHKHFHNEAA